MWSQPGGASPEGPSRGDAMLVAAFVALAVAEITWGGAVGWGDAGALVGLSLAPALLWRRTHPLWTVVIAFGVLGVFNAARLFALLPSPRLSASAFILLLPYALARWGSGREMLLGAPLIFAATLMGLIADDLALSDLLGGVAIVALSMTIGAAMRLQTHVHAREVERAKSRQRDRIARDLHDSVAHHVSGIIIQAQAGQAVMAHDPEAGAETLRVIEAEAKRALSEMRAMVRVLRQGTTPKAPVPGLEALARLVEAPGALSVELTIGPDLDALPVEIAAALYRVAQESLTNARRHARGATRLEIEVTAHGEEVRLSAWNDGAPAPSPGRSSGYGLVGMRERVELLGGRLKAGPDPMRGWRVEATLPRGAP